MSDEVLTDTSDGILTITLNRPAARNAANRALAEGVSSAIDQLEADDSLRVAILTGAGGTFCSGMDLKAFVSGEYPVVEGRGFAGMVEYLASKPIIAAVEGYALAGGFELAISCDLIVAADDAQFGIPEVRRGLTAAAGGLVRLPKQIPPRIAMELALTGDFISAARAYELGLINRVVKPGTAIEQAMVMARAIASNGPLAVAASKRVIALAGDWTRDDMFEKQNAITGHVFTSEDAIEGATAFAQKRAPQWKGR